MKYLREKENVKNEKSGYRFFYIIAIVIGLASLTYSLKLNSDNQFEKNKVQTSGILKNIILDTHSSEYASYKRYILEYEYNADSQTWSKVFECKYREINSYFDEMPTAGDSILIAYNVLNPIESKPVRNN